FVGQLNELSYSFCMHTRSPLIGLAFTSKLRITAFDAAEYLQLVELLYKRPEWRAELRQLLLSEDTLALPQVVRELAEAQKRTDQKVDRLASEPGGLKALIGASLEEEATAVTETVMREKGFRS
ncbi:MAG: hypothetical protein ACK44E_10230, partial [Anaerolineales bacterium]